MAQGRAEKKPISGGFFMAFVVFHDLPGGVYSSGVGLTWMVGIQMLILLWLP